MSRHKLILLAILVLAVVLRIYGALSFPFEQDELYTIDEATSLFHTRLQPGIQARPVFFLLEHPVVTALPHTPTVLRAFPFIVGLLGVWVTWILGARILGTRAGIVAALLAAVSPWHMYASGFGRYYSLLYLLAALVYWLLPRAYDSDRPRDYLAVLVPLLVGGWTHPSFVFPVACAALAVMLVDRDGTVRWRWPSAEGWRYLWLPFVGVSALVFAVIRAIAPARTTVANGGSRGLLATARLIPAMVDWMTPTVFVLALLGTYVLLRSREPGRRRFAVMALLGTAGMIVALFALSFTTAIYADYGIAALPLVFAACGGFVEWLGEVSAAGDRRSVTVSVVLLALVGVFPFAASYLSDGSRFDYRPAFRHIIQTDSSVAVLTTPLAVQHFYAPQLRSYELPHQRPRLDSLLARERNLWAVVSVKRYGIVGDDSGVLEGWLTDRCRPAMTFQRPRLDYRMYRVDLWRCRASL